MENAHIDNAHIDNAQLNRWFPVDQQRAVVAQLLQRVGLTRIRAEYFVRLWVYLSIKHQQTQNSTVRPPLAHLDLPSEPIICTYREAASIFYGEKELGSDRAAGLMIDKFAALGLLRKFFDGNTTSLEILPIPELTQTRSTPQDVIEIVPDAFNARCDAIPVAHLLAHNYNWMNRNLHATPHRIAKLLRSWSQHYSLGMRVLRRLDNQNPVGFCLLYPVANCSEAVFFQDPNRGLHFSSDSDTDPFTMAVPGDETCLALYVRSWVIDSAYIATYQGCLLQDAQQTIQQMKTDFPNLCDLYSMIMHPTYEALAAQLGFQKLRNAPSSIYWMYLAIDRFLELDMPTIFLSR
jgi:hypothetical protein